MERGSTLCQVRCWAGERVQRNSRSYFFPPQLTCKLECNQGSEAISIQDVGSIEIWLEFSSQNLCHPKDLSERCFAKTIFSSWQLNGKDVESGRQEIFPERKLRSSATG